MIKFLKFAGWLVTVLTVAILIFGAGLALLMIGDTGPAWTVGIGIVIAPFLYWLFRQFCKIDWGD